MHSLDLQVIDAAIEWSEARPVWLCTVLSTYGSSPRPPGAMMVIRSDGRFVGSLSGGCVEESFVMKVSEAFFSEASQIVRYGEGGYEPDRSLPCGGVLDILVEKLPPQQSTWQYLQEMQRALTSSVSLMKRVILPNACNALERVAFASRTSTLIRGGEVILTLSSPPRVIIAGLSSVALFCADYALSLGFETIVCEHRKETLMNMASELDQRVRLIRQFPAAYLEKEGCHPGTAILSLTHDPRIDDLTMMEAVNLPAFYIGAMGSHKNSQRRKERLVRIGELASDQIGRIHAPVGINIGSKTPAEIALSIMADVVRHKNGLTNF